MSDTFDLRYTGSENQRLDRFLAGLNHPRLHSRAAVEKILAAGCVLVNDNPARKSFLLSDGDVITVTLPAAPESSLVPQPIRLDIIYEDEFLAVINKPADMVVHPGHGNPDNTLANAIAFRYSDKLRPTETNRRPGIVHRLDKGTSGLIIVARDESTQAKLSELFARRKVTKTYLAVTVGIPDPPVGVIESQIARSPSNPRRMAVSHTGRLAKTAYEVLHYFHFFALLKLNLGTGRMHQIRVHLAHKGVPVLGDPLYNSAAGTLNRIPVNLRKKMNELLVNHLQRQALHAWKLQFDHPVTGQPLAFTAPLPEDFIYLLDWLDNYFAIDNVRLDKKLFD
jgi:23S rRNA pseudouridine1911/1915/1917 synthase